MRKLARQLKPRDRFNLAGNPITVFQVSRLVYREPPVGFTEHLVKWELPDGTKKSGVHVEPEYDSTAYVEIVDDTTATVLTLPAEMILKVRRARRQQ